MMVPNRFTGAEIGEFDISPGADLSDADLSGANLHGANLHGAKLCGADLSWTNLRGAKLCGADLCDADLSWADLRRADLCDARLSGAKLCGADLCDADLSWADLCDARLSGAKLRGANLRGVILDWSPELGLEKRTLEHILDHRDDLKMDIMWHTCDTRHCAAGFICHLSQREDIKEFENKNGTPIAAMKLLGPGAGHDWFEQFYNFDEESVLDWMEKRLKSNANLRDCKAGIIPPANASDAYLKGYSRAIDQTK